jgi:hypothetical protein
MRRVILLSLLLVACSPKTPGAPTAVTGSPGASAAPGTTSGSATATGPVDLSKFPAQKDRKLSYHYEDPKDVYEDVYTVNAVFKDNLQIYVSRTDNGKQVTTADLRSLPLYQGVYFPDPINSEGFYVDRDWSKVTTSDEAVTVKAGTFQATKVVYNDTTYWFAKPYIVKATSTEKKYQLELTKIE